MTPLYCMPDPALDFVLVWEIRSRRKRRGKANVPAEEGEAAAREESSRSERRKAQQAQWREKFVQNLQSAGLLMEQVLCITLLLINAVDLQYWSRCCLSSLQEETANEKKTIYFLKVSAPWDVLVYYAEELCVRAPLQVSAAVSVKCVLIKISSNLSF